MNITRGARDAALSRKLSGDGAACRPYHIIALAMLLWTADIAFAQSDPEVRRALPLDQPPVRRALPADDSIDKVLRSLKDQDTEPSARETEGADQRQLDYANGLFARKLYDLAIPEIGRASCRERV